MFGKKSKNRSKIIKLDDKREKTSAWTVIKQCLLGGFHTFFIIILVYFIIMLGTTLTPQILAYILGGLGFGGSDVQSGAVFIVSLMAGFFLTAWIFVISFIAIRFCCKVYARNMRKCLPRSVMKKMDSFFRMRDEDDEI